jgi:hypothetical protein
MVAKECFIWERQPIRNPKLKSKIKKEKLVIAYSYQLLLRLVPRRHLKTLHPIAMPQV